MRLKLAFFLVMLMVPSSAFSFFQAFKEERMHDAFAKGSFKKVKVHLEEQQVHSPFDEQVNFRCR